MAERTLLHLLLLVAMALAPVVTRVFFLRAGTLFTVAHVVAVLAVATGLLADLQPLTAAWPLFCAFGAGLLVKQRVRSLREVALGVPFAFSLVGATWLFAGSNDLKLLGYGPEFSFYAALHGHVLGWILLACLARLAEVGRRRFYTSVVVVCFVAFLLIAFGIDGAPYIKRVGVVVLSVLLPLAQLAFLIGEARKHRGAMFLGVVSLLGLTGTMVLAWMNELAVSFPWGPLGVRAMVSLHGAVNLLVVVPCFFFAVLLATTPIDRAR